MMEIGGLCYERVGGESGTCSTSMTKEEGESCPANDGRRLVTLSFCSDSRSLRKMENIYLEEEELYNIYMI